MTQSPFQVLSLSLVENIPPGTARAFDQVIVNIFFQNVCGNRFYEFLHVWFTCAFRMLMCLCGFMLIFVYLCFETKTKATYFWCTYVQKRMNRCVCVNDGEASGFFYAMKYVCGTFLSVEVWVWV